MARGNIHQVTVLTPDKLKLEVQFVKEDAMIAYDPLPDFDINTIIVNADGRLGINPRFSEFVELRSAVANCIAKQCVQLKRIGDLEEQLQLKMRERIKKMSARGFKILNLEYD